MRISGVYSGEPGAIAAARQLAVAFFEQLSLPDPAVRGRVVEDAQLVVSELVTNAVRHTSGPCGLDIERVGNIVEITVWDTSPHHAVVTPPDPARVGQHGMEIVLALCGAFEVTDTATGKRITVRLDLSSVVA